MDGESAGVETTIGQDKQREITNRWTDDFKRIFKNWAATAQDGDIKRRPMFNNGWNALDREDSGAFSSPSSETRVINPPKAAAEKLGDLNSSRRSFTSRQLLRISMA